MKKLFAGLIVLALVFSVASAASASITKFSGEMRPVLEYSKALGTSDAKPLLGFICSDLTASVIPMDNVAASATLRLQNAGTADLLYLVSVETDDLLFDGLDLRVGKLRTPFTEFAHYLLTVPESAGWAPRRAAAYVDYVYPGITLTGGVNATTVEAENFVVKLATDVESPILMEGLYLAGAYKSDKVASERVGSFAIIAAYQIEAFCLDIEYASQASGDVKPSLLSATGTFFIDPEWLVSVRYEGLTNSTNKSIITGGVSYQLRTPLKAVLEVASWTPETGDSQMVYKLGLIYKF